MTEIREVAVHDTADPEVIVAEQVVVAGQVTIPGLLVLRVRDGRLVRVRDYLDGYGVAAAGRGGGG
ncbi:hypothetical protein [Streptomyces humi]|uniref:hypothetical protein n=1 Tax=Streptomyces humi TaxID=1428620 RepID=UPI001F0A7B93|nr:hypothetical protein [Streptomyces humi]